MRVVGAAAALLVAAAWVAVVLAHAEPVRVVPGDGAVLNASPSRVVMEMSQAMKNTAGANDIDVFDSSGREVTTAAATVDSTRKVLTVQLPSLAAGDYTVRWKTLSDEDGENANGETKFKVDPRATPSAGKEQLRDAPATTPGADDHDEPAASGDDNDDGTSWVAVAAAVVAVLAVVGAVGFLMWRRNAQ